MRLEKTLMAYEEDIKNGSFRDWMVAHTASGKPLHRYEGILELEKEKMVFNGRDVKQNKNLVLEISIDDITDVYLGFDDVFRKRDDYAIRQTRTRGFVPLRVTYKSAEEKKTMYLFTDFHYSKRVRWASSNKETYEKIKAYLG